MNKDALFTKRNILISILTLLLTAFSAYVTLVCYEPGTGLYRQSTLPTVFYISFGILGLLCILFGLGTKRTLTLAGKKSPTERFFSVFSAVLFLADAVLMGYLTVTHRIVLVGFDSYSYYIRTVFALLSAVYFILRGVTERKRSELAKIYLSFAPLIYFALTLIDRIIDTDVNINSPQKHLHIVSLCIILIFLLLESRMMTYNFKHEDFDMRVLRIFSSLSVFSAASVVLVHIVLALLGYVDTVTLITSDLCELSVGALALARLFEFRKYKCEEDN